MIDLTTLPILDTDTKFSTLPDLCDLTWNKFQVFWNEGMPGKAANVLKIEYYCGSLNEYNNPQNSYQIDKLIITLAEGKEVYEKTKLVSSDFDDEQMDQIDGLNLFHKQALKHTRNITNDLAVDGDQNYLFGCRIHTSKTKFDEKNFRSKTKFGKKGHSDIIAYLYIDNVNNKTCLRVEWKGYPIVIDNLSIVENPAPGQSVMQGYFNTEAMKHQYGRIQNKKAAVLEGTDLINIKKLQKQLLDETRAKFLEIEKFPTFVPHKIELSKTKFKNQQRKAEQEALEQQPEKQIVIEVDELQQYNQKKQELRQELLQQLKIEAIDYLTAPEFLSEKKEIEMTTSELASALSNNQKQVRIDSYNQKLQEFQDEYELLVQLCETKDFETDEAVRQQAMDLNESWVERITQFNEEYSDIIEYLTSQENNYGEDHEETREEIQARTQNEESDSGTGTTESSRDASKDRGRGNATSNDSGMAPTGTSADGRENGYRSESGDRLGRSEISRVCENFVNDDPEYAEIAKFFGAIQDTLNRPVEEKKQVPQYTPKTSKSGLFIIEGEHDHFPVKIENTLEELEQIKLKANRERSLAKMAQLGITKYDSMALGDGDDFITREDVRRLYGDDFFVDDYGTDE
jgi:hypothetical protein